MEFLKIFLSTSYVKMNYKKIFLNLCEAFQIRIKALIGNNIACQRLECCYRSFCQGNLVHLKESPLIRKDGISSFQNSQKIPEREKSSHFKV